MPSWPLADSTCVWSTGERKNCEDWSDTVLVGSNQLAKQCHQIFKEER